jgi:hypothetical protein
MITCRNTKVLKNFRNSLFSVLNKKNHINSIFEKVFVKVLNQYANLFSAVFELLTRKNVFQANGRKILRQT